MLPASSNEPDRDSSGRRSLRRWGPVGLVVTIALVVGGILLFDDDADAPGDTAPPTSPPTPPRPPRPRSREPLR